MSISNPEVEAGDKTDGIIGFKKRRVSLKQGLASVFQRIQSSQSNFDCNRPHCSMSLSSVILKPSCRGAVRRFDIHKYRNMPIMASSLNAILCPHVLPQNLQKPPFGCETFNFS